MILGEALPNLEEDNCTSELEDILGLKVRDNDGIEVEVTCDDLIDTNEKVHFF